jgi:hypothetical protein
MDINIIDSIIAQHVAHGTFFFNFLTAFRLLGPDHHEFGRGMGQVLL